MPDRVRRFIRLPLLLLLVFTIARLSLGWFGVPYCPHGNAMFSVGWLTVVSCFFWGALSKKAGGLSWRETALTGYAIGLASQLLIFLATWASYTLPVEGSYFRDWDFTETSSAAAVPMAAALLSRAQSLVVGPFLTIVPTLIGRLFGRLAPETAVIDGA